ncbi:MAG: hypothetical protein IM638_04315 [Bacteroidetes bacterium]|nr:hypothetical protein [Bacteroidota bacterium]
MSPQVKSWLEQYGVKPKTPWYSFTGLMLVGAALVGFLIFSAVEIRNRNAAMQELLADSPELNEYFSEDAQVPVSAYSLKDEFQHARPGDFLMFTDSRLAIITVQVNRLEQDQYVLLIPDPVAAGRPVEDGGLVDYFSDSTAVVKKVRIAKQIILGTVPASASDTAFKGEVIAEFSHLTRFPVKAWRVERSALESYSE